MKFFKLILYIAMLEITHKFVAMEQKTTKESRALTTTSHTTINSRSKSLAFLGLPEDATDEQVQQRVKRLAGIYHPDKPLGNTAQFQLLQQHKDALTNSALQQPKPIPSIKNDDHNPEVQFKQVAHTESQTFKKDMKNTRNKLLLASGACTAATVTLGFLAYRQQQPNPERIKRNFIGETIGSTAGSIASGGITDIVKYSVVAVGVAAGAFGLKQLYNMISRPLDHTEKMEGLHQQKLDSLTNAHRKAMDRQSAAHEKAFKEQIERQERFVKFVQERLEKQQYQQKLHMETTDKLTLALRQAQAKVINLEQRSRSQSEGHTAIVHDLKEVKKWLETVGRESREQAPAINAIVDRCEALEGQIKKLHSITDTPQPGEQSTPQLPILPHVAERRATISGSLNFESTQLAATISSTTSNSQTSDTKVGLVPRVEEQPPPPVPKEKTSCCC